MISALEVFLLTSSLILASGAIPRGLSRAENLTCQFNVGLDTSDVANISYVRMMKNVKLPVSRTTYRYAINPPFDKEKPYLLFLHGFPDTSYGWVNQIEYFTRRGYGIIAPDLLGTGGTDKPIELEAYSLRTMASDIAELLDCEGLDKIIAVSHDLGAYVLSRFHTYQSQYLSALAFLDIGYNSPGTDVNQTFVEAYNNISQATFGYPILGYWYFFDQPDAHVLLDAHLDSLYSLAYSFNAPKVMMENFNTIGALQEWLAADRKAEYGNDFITNSTREQWKTIVRAQGGVEANLKWYKSYLRGINSVDEDEIRLMSGIIEQPSLFIAAERDSVGIPSEQLRSTLPYAPGMQIRTVDAGHFLHIEQADEVNEALYDFIQGLQ
ncbi:Alpha/Beta hydrolase protein [Alternaria rosae]|uniref:Alpha/Beta hydrolase protein n=1 Tax=Alternaria rosae TaxID=1187941 RepID=UPI001E8CBC65|nr:Alpha/Beta hydrolase protein [Alternaria rosae]KAH6865264.1 Alpha/Beta hydrolase protein [Alternaria rosae]